MNFKLSILVILIFTFLKLNAQKTPSLIIDSTEIQFSDVSLPFWLKAGQSVGLGVNAKIVSVLEFTINGTALEFSRVLTLINKQTVPSNKAWKIEGIGLNKGDTLSTIGSSQTNSSVSSSGASNIPFIFQSPVKFETPGTYNWKVPPGITTIWIEVWGGGGQGGGIGGKANYSSGGGGGSYGYGRFTVVPGTLYVVTVGAGGNITINSGSGGSSSVGTLISANGGARGGFSNNFSTCAALVGGNGGTSSASFNLSGEIGSSSLPCNGPLIGNGGDAANGGIGGSGNMTSTGGNGQNPGGGGGGAYNAGSSGTGGGLGGRGQVYIYF
jgi:hypothetical protein